MPTDRLFCSACGSKNQPDAAFCEGCGNRLGQPVPSIREAQPAQPATENPAKPVAAPNAVPQQKSRGGILMLVLLLLLAGGAAWALGAPMPGFLSRIGINSRSSFDSVQFAPVAQNVTLADTPFTASAVTSPPIAPPVAMTPAAVVSPMTSPLQQNKTKQRSTADGPTAEMPKPPDLPGVATAPTFTVPDAPASSSPSASNTGAASTNNAPAPSAPEPIARIPAGSVISLRSANEICSDKALQGSKFTAIVQQDVSGENGAAIPRGTAMTFVVDRSKAATASEKAVFSVAAESVPLGGEQHPVKASVDAVTIKEKSRSLLGALVGAVAGAAAANAAGGNAKTTIGGAVAGGAAGGIIGNQIRSGNGCIEKNAPIRITLTSDITM